MITELGGVVAENTKMEMLATHFVAILPNDTFTGMMVCALATGKWLIHVNFIYDSFRCKKFLQVRYFIIIVIINCKRKQLLCGLGFESRVEQNVSMICKDLFRFTYVCEVPSNTQIFLVRQLTFSLKMYCFFQEYLYEWLKHPKILEIDHTSVEVAKAAVYWHLELDERSAQYPFEGKQIVLIMKKKYRQYYQMIFKTLKAKPVTYDPRYDFLLHIY